MFTGTGQVIMGRCQCLSLTLVRGDLTGVPHGELLVERLTGGWGEQAGGACFLHMYTHQISPDWGRGGC